MISVQFLRDKYGRHWKLLAIALLSTAAAVRLYVEFHRLLFGGPEIAGALDLHNLLTITQSLFRGVDIYREFDYAPFPLASYAMLWPLLGLPDLQTARWIWAATDVLLLAWMIRLMLRDSNAETRVEKLLLALLLLSMNGVGVGIGNGQISLHVLVPLIAGLYLLRFSSDFPRRCLAFLFLLFSLTKPIISVPFLLLVLYQKPLFFFGLVLAYIAITVFSLSFQPAAPQVVLAEWLSRARSVAQAGGYGNIHSWLTAIGLSRWISLASLIALGFFALWVYRNKNIDLAMFLPVAALFARFWTYHRMYDDVLIFLPMIALFRILKQRPGTESERVIAAVILSAAAILNLARLYGISDLRYALITISSQIVWIGMLVFLLLHIKQAQRIRVSQ